VWIPAEEGSRASILVVGDSGTSGAFVRVDAETGEVVEKGKLALDKGASDDLEGLSRIGATFYAITSSGHVRHWQRRRGKWQLTRTSYAVGSEADGTSCADGRKVNCGPNYEGLCLDPDAALGGDGCAGFAASKESGALVCLEVAADGRLRADARRTIQVSRRETLTGCDIADAHVAWAGTNLIGASAVYRITGWRDTASADVTLVGALGPGCPEAMALAPGNILYRFSDTGGAPSLMMKYQCEDSPPSADAPSPAAPPSAPSSGDDPSP
jgi:hypothetical protein